MVRWIAFDDDTAEFVVSRMRRGAAEIQHNSPVDAALGVDGASVIVLPTSTREKLLIARFTPRKDAQFPTAPRFRPPTQSAMGPASRLPLAQRKDATSEKKPWWRNVGA
jgi:hypothetical protein